MAETTSTEIPTESTAKRSSRFVFLMIFFVILLLGFTLLKLPQSKITNLIQGYVQTALDPMGIYLSDRGRELSILHGFQYRLNHPTLELSDGTRVEMDELIVSPSLFSLLRGKMGAVMTLTQGNAKIEFSGQGAGDRIDATIKLEDCDLNKLGLLAYAGGMKGGGLISGDVHIDGTLSDVLSLTGYAQLKLKKVRLDEQNIAGFQLPTINVSEGTIDLVIESGKLIAKTVSLGKGNDDVLASLTGDVTLNRFLNASILNMRAVLGMSEKLKLSLGILESMLTQGKQADGKYAFKLTGTLGAPFPMPDPK